MGVAEGVAYSKPMSEQADIARWGLTEKEKETLRLMVRGHDAKSVARSLGLSVHTINERLRDARRKMRVSSSREASRLLFEAEGEERRSDPQKTGDRDFGEDSAAVPRKDEAAPRGAVSTLLLGAYAMLLAIALTVAMSVSTDPVSAPAAAASQETRSPEAVSARAWLELVDQGKWNESYEATGSSFRKLNSVQDWTSASQKARVPFGAAMTRNFLAQDHVAAPPHGYERVKFRTRFANGVEAVESVTLVREDGVWRVVGIMID